MKNVIVMDERSRPVAILECPDDLDVPNVYKTWLDGWLKGKGLSCKPIHKSFQAYEQRHVFVEHLVWHRGCKHMGFEEIAI